MKLYVGTSGYSYKGWKGHFYPHDLAAKEMLRYYSERLGAVEINNTFYRLPTAAILESWASQVPEDFRFSLKASRRITHFKRLKEAGEETSYLLQTAETLGRRLSVVLFQLPPNFKKDLPRLKTFLGLLPATIRTAFEFRHPSWFDEEVQGCLTEHGCALCLSETDEEPLGKLVSTTGFGYLRLRRSDYSEADLSTWISRLSTVNWQQAFIFFKHEEAGVGAKLALRFLAMSLPAVR